MKSEVPLSDSKRKLCALLDKLNDCVKAVSDETCKSVFLKVADFAREALLERTRRIERARSPDLVAVLPLLVVPKRARETAAKVEFCAVCSGHYRKGQQCDGCDASFRWCYTGYSRKPCEDPLYPIGDAQSDRKSLCGDCVKKTPLARESTLLREQECLRVADIFSEARWKWISCLCDGCSVLSVSGVALEGLLFLLFPFYCQAGTEHNVLESCQDPRLRDFVLGCANEALLILAGEPEDSVRVQSWKSVIANRELTPNLVEAEFDLVWKAIANCLSASAPTAPVRICVWECRGHVLECMQCYGATSEFEFIRPRMINVFKWNPGTVTHYDMIVPLEGTPEAFELEDERDHKKVGVSFSCVEKVSLPFTRISSLASKTYPLLSNCASSFVTRILPGKLLCSIRDATFTIWPQTSYEGFLVPITPAITSPKAIPTRIFMCDRLGLD
jgi:hypothetical protein